MKTRFLGIIIFFIIGSVIIYLITIPTVEKWTYDLPNNYAIKKTSDVDVVLGKYIDNEFNVYINEEKMKINDYIAEFSYSENYITLKCIIPVDGGILVRFYIIDSLNNNIYGPYETEEIYVKMVDELINEELSEWIETITKPDGAINK